MRVRSKGLTGDECGAGLGAVLQVRVPEGQYGCFDDLRDGSAATAGAAAKGDVVGAFDENKVFVARRAETKRFFFPVRPLAARAPVARSGDGHHGQGQVFPALRREALLAGALGTDGQDAVHARVGKVARFHPAKVGGDAPQEHGGIGSVGMTTHTDAAGVEAALERG